MPRYIDADALKERLEDFSKWCKDGRKQGVDFVLDCPLSNMPTADVVPKSEVERVYYNLQSVLEERAETKQEIAREIFEEIDKLHIHVSSQHDAIRYAELKKKYTEEKKDEN